jgi:MtN3 and saliva related transmembrane protein
MYIDLKNLLGYIATIISSFYLLPQVIKTWKSKSTADISLGMFILGISGAIIWILYGAMLNSIQIVLTNSIVLISSLIVLTFKIKYK